MNAASSQVLPAPPNLIRTLLAGFDTVANHLSLILFSIGLDLILWFGPQLRLVFLTRSYSEWTIEAARLQSPQMVETLRTSQEPLLSLVERFNLVSILRTLPVGVASLMTGRGPLINPLGVPFTWELSSLGLLTLLWLMFILFGLMLGVLFFALVEQAALKSKITLPAALQAWPDRFIQVFLLSLFWLGLILLISIPLSCVLPFMLIGSGGLGRLALFFYGAFMIWLLFPLAFSPFGIFVHQDKMWASVIRGARLVRYTMPATLLFALIVVVISQGLDMLWTIPAEKSWFGLIGVIGHAFVATGLLAAAFIYYRDAGIYIERRLQSVKA